MKRSRVIAVSVLAALAVGSGIAFAEQAGPARIADEPLLLHAVGNYLTLQPGEEATVLSRQCPAGEMAISGGVQSSAGPGDFTMTVSTPWWNHGPRGWMAGGRNNSSQPFDLYVYGFCTAATMPDTLTAGGDGLPPQLPPGPGALPGRNGRE
ncbi:hypothetical protein ACFC1T_15810 [Kitasatospora sp. NPDC056076]|uniref:hypothetical protein n=1 Tax=Kitasatospora sp. NPDC056076 TaxID=3345703 RepID=UPI0035DBE2AE